MQLKNTCRKNTIKKLLKQTNTKHLATQRHKKLIAKKAPGKINSCQKKKTTQNPLKKKTSCSKKKKTEEKKPFRKQSQRCTTPCKKQKLAEQNESPCEKKNNTLKKKTIAKQKKNLARNKRLLLKKNLQQNFMQKKS